MVTVLAIGAYWVITAVAGALAAGLVRTPLRLEERIAVAAIGGTVLGSLLAFLAALVLGMGTPAALAGPLLLGALALAAALVAGDPSQPWGASLTDAAQRWHSRELWPVAALTAVAAIGFTVAFGHGFFPGGDGSIMAGYATTWADWSLHATSANSFAVGHNLPPHDPIFSGTAYRYPFLPDFNSAMLLTLGSSLRFALEAPNVVLCVAITVLVVSLAQRLTRSFAVGVVAMAIVLLGGGLGFTGLWWDACGARGYADSQCSVGHLVTHPGDALTVGPEVARQSASLIASQPRGYDGLVTPTQDRPLGGAQQWYTPLLSWWLPQRTFVYGFAVVMAVLLLLETGLERAPPAMSPFRIAGLLAGTLPLIHVHSVFVLLIVLPIAALLRRRRGWLDFGVLAAVIALPRLVQIASGGHGAVTASLDDTFPYLQPGWTWNSDPSWNHVHFALSAVPGVVWRTVQVLFSPSFWGFWLLNTGVLVPVCAVVVAGIVLRLAPRGVVHAVGSRIGEAIPRPLLRFCLPFLVIFPVANVVVFQAWDWDNTKLFAYWQFAAALLASAWMVSWWRRRGVRSVLASATMFTLVATGGLAMLRLLPWTPHDRSAGPYTWASATDRQLAAEVERRTPADAVFLTGGWPTDPILTLAGRTAVLGYTGWLFSYGADYTGRAADVVTMYRGCATSAPDACPVYSLLRRYDVSFVRVGAAEENGDQADPAWWASHFPVIARAGDVVVYDVRPR